jgi:hypothetical protein
MDNCERVEGKDLIQIKLKEIDSKPDENIFTMDEITEMINTQFYTVFTCNIEELKNLKIDVRQNEERKKQTMIFMTAEYLVFFLLDKKEKVRIS